MARRNKPILNKRTLAFLALAIVVGSVVGVYFTVNPLRKYSGLTVFPCEQYCNSNSIISNEDHRLTGTIENVLIRSLDGQRILVSIRPENSQLLIPVVMTIGKKIPQREQNLVMKVHIEPTGSIACIDYDFH